MELRFKPLHVSGRIVSHLLQGELEFTGQMVQMKRRQLLLMDAELLLCSIHGMGTWPTQEEI